MKEVNKSEGNMYYVYIYVDPRNNNPFYVGKGFNNRYLVQLWSAKNEKNKTYKANKIRKIIRETGQDPEIILFKTGLSEDEAFSMEIELIKRWGRRDIKTGCLLNLTDGGEGASGLIKIVSKETKHKMSVAKQNIYVGKNNPNYKTGKYSMENNWVRCVKERDNYTCQNFYREEHANILYAYRIIPKDKHPELKYDINNGITLCGKCYNLVRSIYGDTNRKISQKNKGRPNIKKGIPRTDEEKQNISVSLKGKYVGEKAFHYGKKQSEETKRKRSEAQLRFLYLKNIIDLNGGNNNE